MKVLTRVSDGSFMVPPHEDAKLPASVSSISDITNKSSKTKVNSDYMILDKESGTFICPICGKVGTYTVHTPRTGLSVNGLSVCTTGTTIDGSCGITGTITSTYVDL